MTPKELFLSDKELSNKWGAVAGSDWFGKVVVFARGQMLDQKVTTEELEGVRKFVQVLQTISDFEQPSRPYPTAGLNRNLDVPPRTGKTNQKKE